MPSGRFLTACETWLLCLMLGATSGCGSSGSANPDLSGSVEDGGSQSIDQACANWAMAYCGQLQRCSPFASMVSFPDVSACAARYKLICVPTAGLPGTGLSVAGLNACAQALGAAACGDFLSGPNFLPTACRFPGTLAAGQNCGDDSQCSSGSCERPMGSGCGKCVTRMADGSSCAYDADCSYGSICVNPAGGQCATASGMGGACSNSVPCKAGLYCRTGQCVPQQPPGTSCTATGNECDGSRGGYCDPVSTHCMNYALAQVGQVCGMLGPTRVRCLGGAGCFGTTAMNQTCVQPAPDGLSCNAAPTSNGPGCQAFASCAGPMPPMGTCQLFDPASCK